MAHRAAGDPILGVVRSHGWYWRPRVRWRGLEDTISAHWLGWHLRYWRHPPAQ